MNNNVTIGLFGTCGKSTWRKDFIDFYEIEGMEYFNPQKEGWSPADAEIEADHLVNDEILLFPVTAETYAFGSLAETGFSIMQALKFSENRDIVVMIEPDVDMDEKMMSTNELSQHLVLKKETQRARALVKAHLKKVNYPNVWMVESLEDMLELSISLYDIHMTQRDLHERYDKK